MIWVPRDDMCQKNRLHCHAARDETMWCMRCRRDIQKGEVLVEEAPLAAVCSDAGRCSQCISALPQGAVLGCAACPFERWCSATCRDAGLAGYHRQLCGRGTALAALWGSAAGCGELASVAPLLFAVRFAATVQQQSADTGLPKAHCPLSEAVEMLCSYTDQDEQTLSSYACGFSAVFQQYQMVSSRLSSLCETVMVRV